MPRPETPGEAAQRIKDQSSSGGVYGGVQGRPSDPTGALEVQKRMGVSLAAAGQKGFVPPKQDPGEDAGTYARRVADAREAYKQKSAMSKVGE